MRFAAQTLKIDHNTSRRHKTQHTKHNTNQQNAIHANRDACKIDHDTSRFRWFCRSVGSVGFCWVPLFRWFQQQTSTKNIKRKNNLKKKIKQKKLIYTNKRRYSKSTKANPWKNDVNLVIDGDIKKPIFIIFAVLVGINTINQITH